MDNYRELADKLKEFNVPQGTIYQGIVKSVDGILCSVTMGSIDVPGVRLRASEADDDSQMLVVPKIGSAVIVGSLSGDLSDLVVLQVDEIDKVIINGGQLGGLIKIDELTTKLNDLVKTFNSHTHLVNTSGSSTAQSGVARATLTKASEFSASDYEDEKIIH